MNKINFIALLSSLFAIGVSAAPSNFYSIKSIDDCDLPVEQRGLAIASYSSDPKNEPWYKNSHKYNNTSEGSDKIDYQFAQKETVFDRINIGNTWDSYRGDSVKVAVIDTGCYTTHEDFNGTTISSLSKNTYLTGSSYTDNNGHGTTSAAMIAAAVNNVGGTGVAPNVELLVLKASSNTGAFTVDAINAALNYCAQNHVDVVNLSLQGYTSSFTATYIEDFGNVSTTVSSTGIAGSNDYQEAITNCYNAGCVVVAAAGNYNTDRVSYPAANDHVIAVASTGLTPENTLNKAGYSNYGSWVDVCAPGYVYKPLHNDSDGYSVNYGTSFSAPIVSGAIALYKQKYPTATPSQVEEALKRTCTPVNFSGGGAGQINVSEFLNQDPTIKPESVTITPKTLSLGVGQIGQLTASVYPTNVFDDSVYFESSDENVATVDAETGEVTAIGNGSCTITAYAYDNLNVYDTCEVTVSNAGNYYSGITATDSAGLSAQLHNLMFSTHSWYSSYNDCRNENGAYYEMDPGSTSAYLTDFYTQHDIDKTWSGNSSGTWNREHIWCQSKSAGLWNDTTGSTKGGGADYHHIRPIEHNLNSTRNNNPYGEVNNKNSSTEKYSKTTNGTNAYLGGYLENGVWEPLDSIKGDIARILMYIFIHYSSNAGGTTPSQYSSYVGNLQFKDIICEGSSESASKAMLLKWHNQDPVSAFERARNEAAFSYQGNRNPFIDHPEYANTIFATDVVHVTSVSLNTNAVTLLPGSSETLTATVLPVDANNKNVSWNSNNTDVATVSSSGKITAVAPGSATITVTTVDGSKTATCSVTVNPIHVTGISLNTTETSIILGNNQTLTATISPSNATNKSVTWSSGDTSIATVDSNGKVTGVSVGTTTITVTSTDVSTISASCTVHITPILVTGITLNSVDKTLDVGGTWTYTATVSPSNASNKIVLWESSQPLVASVDQNGLVTAHSPGTTNITAKATDGSGIVSAPKVVTVKNSLVSISFVDLPEEIDFGSHDGCYQAVVQANYSDGTHTEITEGFGRGTFLTVDTTKLGNANLKAVYSGATTINATVKVTNHGSSQQPHTVEGGTETTEITKKTFSENGNVTIGGSTFTMESDTTYFNYESARGQQIGSGGSPISAAKIIKRNQMRVTKVIVNSSGADKTNATMRVKVGNAYFDYKGVFSAASTAEATVDSASLTKTATNYLFEGDSVGDISIEWEQTSSTAVYFKGMEVETQTTTIESFTGREQAEAWANYFIDKTRGSNGPCLLSNENQKVSGLSALWNDVKYEYENMTVDGKDAFCDPSTSTLIHDALKHYQYIVTTYGQKGSLTDFVKDSNNVSPSIINNSHSILKQVFDNSTISIVFVVVAGLASICAFVIYKKRKEN